MGALKSGAGLYQKKRKSGRRSGKMFFPLFGFLLLLTNSSLASRKNVLLIIADDLRPNLNSYLPTPSFSSPEIHTPNLDELAATSAVFTRAYVQYALCGPSRNSFLTGRRPDTTRCYAEHQFRKRGLDVAVTLPQYFKENGYMTLGMGKVWHPGMPNTPVGDDYPKSWSEKMFHTNSTDKMVEFVDILPTLVEAAGFPPVDKCPVYSRNITFCREGMSVMPILGGWGEGKDAVFYQQGRGYYLMNHPERFVQGCTVMTTQYRYTEYVGLSDAETEEQQPNWGDVQEWGELYDLEADPQENFNLYRDHDYLDLK